MHGVLEAVVEGDHAPMRWNAREQFLLADDHIAPLWDWGGGGGMRGTSRAIAFSRARSDSGHWVWGWGRG